MSLVRIDKSDLNVIVTQTLSSCGATNVQRIGVFGSRADMSKKGGDLDLYIEVNDQKIDSGGLASAIRVALWEKLGEQKIDILIWNTNPAKNSEQTRKFRDVILPQCVFIWGQT